jgi:hypothetical protein
MDRLIRALLIELAGAALMFAARELTKQLRRQRRTG